MSQTSRRSLLTGLLATAGFPSLSCSLPTLAYAGKRARRRAAQLPVWRYGRSSVAPDAMLMFRGNGPHTFYGTGPIPELAPQIAWRFRTARIHRTLRGKPIVWAGTGWTGTAVKLGSYVFTGSVGGYVYALEADSGRLVWQCKGRGMFKGSPCLYENRLYIGNTDNLLRCIDAASGRTLWRHDTGNDLDSSPCVIDGRLYIAGENGYVRCLDPANGRLIWKCFVGGIGEGSKLGSNGSETSPAVADGELYAATYDGVLFCIDTDTGKVRWRAKTYDDTDASAVVDGEHVYACAEERASHVYCFERKTGKEIWRYSGNTLGYWSTPAIAEGRLHVGGQDGALHTIDTATGTPVWRFQTGAAVCSSPAVVDGKVLFGSRDHYFYCLDAKTGDLIWKVKLDGRIISSPCIIGGKIWIGTATGYFYCLAAAPSVAGASGDPA